MEKLGLNTSKKTKIENSESSDRSPIISKITLTNQNREVNTGSQYEDVDTEKNKMYIDVLKKYFGYKSFRP